MLGTAELIIIFCVILLLFGGKRLPELARSIGIGIREFKKAIHDTEDPSHGIKPTQEKLSEEESIVVIVDPKKKEP